MNEKKPERLALIAKLVGLVACYLAAITLLFWAGVRYGGLAPSSSVSQAVLLFLWPASGLIRWLRQLQAGEGKPQFVHEAILLAGLSLVLAGCLLLSAGQPWWLLSAGISVWAFTLFYLLVHVVFADAIANFLVKHKLATRTMPPRKDQAR